MHRLKFILQVIEHIDIAQIRVIGQVQGKVRLCLRILLLRLIATPIDTYHWLGWLEAFRLFVGRALRDRDMPRRGALGQYRRGIRARLFIQALLTLCNDFVRCSFNLLSGARRIKDASFSDRLVFLFHLCRSNSRCRPCQKVQWLIISLAIFFLE